MLLSLESVIVNAFLVCFCVSILFFYPYFHIFHHWVFLIFSGNQDMFQYYLVRLCSIERPYFRNVRIWEYKWNSWKLPKICWKLGKKCTSIFFYMKILKLPCISFVYTQLCNFDNIIFWLKNIMEDILNTVLLITY